MSKQSTDSKRIRGFTLMELLVVIGIIVVLAAISVPALKTLTKGNDNSQAVNLVRAMLSSARAIAVSQHRQAGVVFFEETSQYSLPVNSAQTAMQIFVEDYDQNRPQYAGRLSGNTIYVAYNSTRQYLPGGVKIATLNDQSLLLTGNNSATPATEFSRAILFDAEGNVVLRNGLARPDLSGGPGTYPQAYGDWHFVAKNGTSLFGQSSPGFFVFNMNDYLTQFPTSGVNNPNRMAWIKANATPVLINANTGMVIREK